jgi:hypothetical protein
MTKIRLALKQFFERSFPTIKHHFDLVHDGKEDLVIVLWIWGGGAYLATFFINKLILFTKLLVLKWLICLLVIAYFVWHIIIIRRCSPKKPPVSAEEKERLKKDRVKRFLRKLFLQEPFTKWDPAIIAMAIDLYVIVVFLEYLAK